MNHSLQRDNNRRGFFDDAPFPTLDFPSDHAFLTCELNLRRRNSQHGGEGVRERQGDGCLHQA